MNYILVTGCNGFIGSRLTKALLDSGYDVLGVSSQKNNKNDNHHFKYFSINLTDSVSVEQLFSDYNISVVIHLAAIAHYKHDKSIDWNDFYRVNTLASKTIFKCAEKAGASIFYSSTVDVYGNYNNTLITEETPPFPVSDYAKSKYLGEKYLENLNVKNYLIARLAPVYGKGLMKDVYKRIYLKYPYIGVRIGAGYNYHFLSINNVVEFIVHWLENHETISGIFNVSDNELVNSNHFLGYERKFGNPKFIINIPSKFIEIFRVFFGLINIPLKNHFLSKILVNLNKLIRPNRYSEKKTQTILPLRWNIKNTIYKKEE